jgi:hypothetical protein
VVTPAFPSNGRLCPHVSGLRYRRIARSGQGVRLRSNAHGYVLVMASGVRFSWRAFGVALGVLLLAVALFGVASYRDSWGSLPQYSLGTLAVLAVAAIGYVVGRPWVLLLPWAVAAAWSIVAAVVTAVRPTREGVDVDVLYGVALLGLYAFVVTLALAVGLAPAVIRNRRRRDVGLHRDRVRTQHE